MNATLSPHQIQTIELPYEWRHSPWVLNVPDSCVRDMAVAIMHQAICDAQILGKGKTFYEDKYEPVESEDDRDNIVEWIYSPQFERLCDSINEGKNYWTLQSMRYKLEDLLK